jgi:hypothetical protein
VWDLEEVLGRKNAQRRTAEPRVWTTGVSKKVG